MPEKHLSDVDNISLIFTTIIGTWGSILSFLKRERSGYSFLKAVSMFLTDMFTNIGFTILTYLGLIGYGVNELLAVSIAGFIGHQGTRAIYLAELAIADKIGSKSALEAIKKENEIT